MDIQTLVTRLKESLDGDLNSVATIANLKLYYGQMCDVLNKASEAYYRGEESGLTDSEFDFCFELLKKTEATGKIFIRLDSPTQKVNGGTMQDKVKHVIPMLSLSDLFHRLDISDWYKTQAGNKFSVEPKIDGLSVELWYEQGQFRRAVTRGNGWQGEDVTVNASKIKTIPLTIPYQERLVVRGEVYMSKEAFAAYQKDEDPGAKNARNMAVGIFKRKDGGLASGKYLDCWVFNVQDYVPETEDRYATHEEQLDDLARWGFHVIPHTMCTDLPQILAAVDKLGVERDGLPFQIDGAVIKENNLMLRKRLGDNGTTPRWAVAYKYPPKEASTKIKDIVYQLGKTGKLTPVAILDPVEVDGSTVGRCTLHNRNRMLELDIRIGDIVTLHKAGDIIPKITTAVHTDESQPFSYPETCPVCGAKLDGERCVNDACPSKIESKLYLWADKGGLDFKGVSGGLVSQLIELGLVKTPADYYKLTPADLYKIPKMGTTRVKKILTAIAATKTKLFPEVLAAMGIEGLGWAAASKLTSHVHSWETLESLSPVECINYTGMSVGNNLYRALQTEYYKNLIQELKVIFPYQDKD